ncbi:hypothetical protein B0H14DRAFT_2558065 [Mycena olivaceomarginata]|nr:hypothetical protein B0H14DRAFT_2558065 [Mycena olivaceomarginata]
MITGWCGDEATSWPSYILKKCWEKTEPRAVCPCGAAPTTPPDRLVITAACTGLFPTLIPPCKDYLHQWTGHIQDAGDAFGGAFMLCSGRGRVWRGTLTPPVTVNEFEATATPHLDMVSRCLRAKVHPKEFSAESMKLHSHHSPTDKGDAVLRPGLCPAMRRVNSRACLCSVRFSGQGDFHFGCRMNSL